MTHAVAVVHTCVVCVVFGLVLGMVGMRWYSKRNAERAYAKLRNRWDVVGSRQAAVYHMNELAIEAHRNARAKGFYAAGMAYADRTNLLTG